MVDTGLQKHLLYDCDTGEFHWVVPTHHRFKPGDRAGSTNGDGYREIWVNGVRYTAHKLAWYFSYGVWPEGDLDHVNGVRADNRLVNLRAATRHSNAANRQKITGCSSQFKGVYWHKGRKRWVASIGVHDKRIFLGRFKNEVEAALAYDEAAKTYFKDFANLNFKDKTVD